MMFNVRLLILQSLLILLSLSTLAEAKGPAPVRKKALVKLNSPRPSVKSTPRAAVKRPSIKQRPARVVARAATAKATPRRPAQPSRPQPVARVVKRQPQAVARQRVTTPQPSRAPSPKPVLRPVQQKAVRPAVARNIPPKSTPRPQNKAIARAPSPKAVAKRPAPVKAAAPQPRTPAVKPKTPAQKSRPQQVSALSRKEQQQLEQLRSQLGQIVQQLTQQQANLYGQSLFIHNGVKLLEASDITAIIEELVRNKERHSFYVAKPVLMEEDLKLAALRRRCTNNVLVVKADLDINNPDLTNQACVEEAMRLLREQSGQPRPAYLGKLTVYSAVRDAMTALDESIKINKTIREFGVTQAQAIELNKFFAECGVSDRKLAKKYYDFIQALAGDANARLRYHALCHNLIPSIERDFEITDPAARQRYMNIIGQLTTPGGWGDFDAIKQKLIFLLTNDDIKSDPERIDPTNYARFALKHLLFLQGNWDSNLDEDTNFAAVRTKLVRFGSALFWAEFKQREQRNQQAVLRRFTNSEFDKTLSFNGRSQDFGVTYDQYGNQTQIKTIRLKRDYDLVRLALQALQAAAPSTGPRFNYLRVGGVADPNLIYGDADALLPPDTNDIQKIKTWYDTDVQNLNTQIMAAYTTHRNQVLSGITDTELRANVGGFFSTYKIGGGYDVDGKERFKFDLRRRIIRMVKYFSTGAGKLDSNPQIALAKLAVKIAENDSSRCNIGIGDWLTSVERQMVVGSQSTPNDDASAFSFKVHQALTNEKIKHLDGHIPPVERLLRATRNFHEIRTCAWPLLIQRLRLPFALSGRIPYNGLYIPYSWAGMEEQDWIDIFDPVTVVKRFFKGGTITWAADRIDYTKPIYRTVTRVHNYVDYWGQPQTYSYEVPETDYETIKGVTTNVQAFTVDRFVNLIHQLYVRGTIEEPLVQRLAMKDTVLRNAYYGVFNTGTVQENEYFRRSTKRGEKFKPRAFQRLLEDTNWLLP